MSRIKSDLDERVRIKSERMNLTQFQSEKRNTSKLIFGSHVKVCECVHVSLDSQSNSRTEREQRSVAVINRK